MTFRDSMDVAVAPLKPGCVEFHKNGCCRLCVSARRND
jgi:hypothetical protein